MRKTLAMLLFLVMFLSACSPPTGPSPETPAPVVNNELPSPTVAASPTSTSTSLPPTETPEPTVTPTSTPIPIPDDYGPDNFPDDVNPLTGLPVSDPTLLDRRPLSVKIQTYPRGQRPDWGVSLADIVYDYYQNNGLTRLNAIFYGNDAEQVGPIRSGRRFDAILTRMYKSIFAFGGADRQIYKYLTSFDFSDRLVLEGSKTPMKRIEPNSYNYLVTNTEELSQYADDNGIDNERPDLTGMTFQYQAPDGGEAGTDVYTRYSISAYNHWQYDPDTGRYLRFQDKQEDTGQGEAYEPFTDRLNNQQVAADNVVVLFAPHSYWYRSGNSEIIEITLNGTGQAYLFRDGRAYQANWNRPNLDAVLYLTDDAGEVIPFKQGVTWFQVIGETSEVETDGGEWRFVFAIP